uniref:Competence protein ComEC n=1 Tax=Candidatus Kentrum sp. FM TaxID=2126340 RepID=A0A450TPW0_9GAMM|nr:MAG: competence protein ComEC [Candidatus Kentron sp. FM]VFJ70047.1 MAG: competence protein ComEC [Candidatus Kentron sp. FM]VFK18067.1 MAG: competence protein ComEC [Candidatus Kentron sp. FM]
MRTGAIAFLAGILLLVNLSNPVDPSWAGFLPALVLVAVFAPRPVRILAWFGMGFLWASFRAGVDLANVLPAALEGHDLAVEGIVVSLPVETGRKTRFLLDITEAPPPPCCPTSWGPGRRIRLDWYGSPPRLLPGERWRLTVRLKRPRGFRNPGGFDYEQWLFRQGIGATGYVRSAHGSDQGNERLPGGENLSLSRLRYRLARAIGEILEDTHDGASPSYAGIVKALAIGVRDDMTQGQWTTLRVTGTAHLMAISGLHIGLVTTLLFFAARWLWVLFPGMVLRLPAQRLAAPVALAGALGYAALAGFSLPTQRALVMACVVMADLFWRRNTPPGFSLALALSAILLLDPLCVLSLGFWLSFAAVAVLLFAMTGRPSPDDSWWRGLWRHWGRTQVVIAVGLLPLTVLFFHQHALVGPLANLLAIPWMGFVVMPLVLAGTCLVSLLPDLGALLLSGGERAIALLWPLLQGLESVDLVYRKGFAPPFWSVLAAGVGVFLLLLPRGMPGRWLGAVWLLPLFLVPPPRPAPGEVWFTLLDVGQGLAAVVRTREHVLVYDTGPAYSSGFDAGANVIVPFLEDQGIGSVDRVVISHSDADHAGGLKSFLAHFPVDGLFAGTSTPKGTVVSGAAPGPVSGTELCRDGISWRWDGVGFRFLHPPPGETARGNNGSCVLKVTTAAGTILLTGDIQDAAEGRLLRNHAADLPVDILVVPHHGSNSSSGPAFLAAVQPRYALFPVGYRNRFVLPAEAVVERYRQAGARLFFSNRDGAIGFRLTPGEGISGPALYRQETRRIWHDSPSR